MTELGKSSLLSNTILVPRLPDFFSNACECALKMIGEPGDKATHTRY